MDAEWIIMIIAGFLMILLVALVVYLGWKRQKLLEKELKNRDRTHGGQVKHQTTSV